MPKGPQREKMLFPSSGILGAFGKEARGIETWPGGMEGGRKLLDVRRLSCGQDRGRQHSFVGGPEGCSVWPGCELREG